MFSPSVGMEAINNSSDFPVESVLCSREFSLIRPSVRLATVCHPSVGMFTQALDRSDTSFSHFKLVSKNTSSRQIPASACI